MKKWKKGAILLAVTVVMLSATTLNALAAGENLFEVADNIIRDVYTHIAGISTVLAALMSAVAVVGAKMSNNQHKVVTRPLSSRHFLWTPVMRYKHNGLPLGFVLS